VTHSKKDLTSINDANHKWLFMQEGAINLSRDQQKNNNLT